MVSGLRRALARAVVAALVIASPGVEPYRAFAAFSSGKAARTPVKVVPQGPSLGAQAFPDIKSTPLRVNLPASAVVAVRTAEAPAKAEAAPASTVFRATTQLAAEAVETLAKPNLSASAAHEVGSKLAGETVRRGAASEAAVDAAASVETAPRGHLSTLARPGPSSSSKRGNKVSAPSAGRSEGPSFVSRIRGSVRGAFRAAALAVAITMSAGAVLAQDAPPAPPAAAGQAADSTKAPAPAVQEKKIPAAPVTVGVSIEKQDVTVGDRVKVTVTIRNDGTTPLRTAGLRSAFNDAIHENLEIQQGPGDEPLTVAPGETKTVVFELIAWDSGDFELVGPMTIAMGDAQGAVIEAEAQIPATTFRVKTVLAKDWEEFKKGEWKKKGFRDIAGAQRPETGLWTWLLAFPLLILLLVGAERLIAAKSRYPRLTQERLGAVALAQKRLEALEAKTELSGSEFYHEFYAALSSFIADFHALPTRERPAETLIRDAAAAKVMGSGQLKVLSDLARRASAFEFDPARAAKAQDGSQRASDLEIFRALIEHMAQGRAPAKKNGGASLGGFSFLSGWTLANPLALLLFVPLIAYAVWSKVRQSRRVVHPVSSTAALPNQKSLRQRFLWLPPLFRALALSIAILIAAHPQQGVTRSDTVTESTDTVPVLDISGSMSGWKLESAKVALKEYIAEQRRTSDNRVGLVTFADQAYLDYRLDQGYDALVSQIKQLSTRGSTAVGDALLKGVGHFLEVNILELDSQGDPRLAELRAILLDKGVPAAMEYIGKNPDLKQTVLQPQRKKIVILFSDGDSNSGKTHPVEAAHIAKALGVKIYTIGIGADVGGYDEKTLRDVAALTDARYVKVTDAAGMIQVLNDIAAAEKSPTKIVASLSIKDYQKELSIAALLLLLASLGFYGAGLRVLRGGIILPLGLAGALALPPQLPLPAPQAPAVQMQAQGAHGRAAEGTVQPFDPSGALELHGMPPEVLEANRLYNRGRYEDALKAYARALESYPDINAIHFNMANAYLRIGAQADPADPDYLDRAQKSYERYLALEKDPKLQSRALYNLGNLSLIRQKAEEALEFYKEALRRASDNQDAKWNLEYLQKMMQEQEKKDGDQQDQDGKKKGKKQKGQKQKGQKGDQKGEPGDEPGEPGDEPGEPGDKTGEGQGQPTDKDAGKDPLQRLGEKLGEAEKGQQEGQRGAIKRKGSGQWGAIALPLAAAGTGVTFSAPAWVWAAAVIVPAVILIFSFVLYRQLKAAKALSPATAPKNAREWWGIRGWWAKTLSVAAAAGLLAVAAGDPKMGVKQERFNFGGNKDIVVLTDVSYSTVYAKDGRRQKIEKGLSQFVESVQGADRIGLVFFAGRARTVSGLDNRHANFRYHIENLERGARGLETGSNLSAAVRHAVAAFDAAKKIEGRRKSVIIVSDGDIFGQDLKEAVEAAKKAGITIYTIGYGTPVVVGADGKVSGGTTMEVPTEDGKGVEPIIDEKTGEPARTGLYEEPLRKLAQETGGRYFPASGAEMKGIMAQIAALEQGEQGDVILAPRSVAAYPAGLAILLLLLNMALPGASLLRRPQKLAPAPAPRKGGKRYSGGALLGLGALSIGSWPALLFAGLGIAALAALLLADYWTGGTFSKKVYWALQRRSQSVEKGLVRDAGILFESREADATALEDFAKAWRSAGLEKPGVGESQRRRLLAEASADAQLWREKLVLAYLYGGSPAGQNALLSSMRQSSKDSFKPLAPLILALHQKRGKLAWLDHPDALRRLADLSVLWLDASDAASRKAVQGLLNHIDDGVALPAARFLGEPRRPARVWTRVSRVIAGAGIAVLVAGLSLAGAGGVGTLGYLDLREQKKTAVLSDFYGTDMRMFSDRYADERIPTEVLPAFREWHHPRGERALERAIEILAKSADPKADNLLEAAFKNADVMPLSEKAEATLLKALLLRENDEVWKFMLAHMERSSGSEKLAGRLMRMVDITMTLGEERHFQLSFYFLHSPNEDVRQHTLQAIYKNLSEKDKGEAYYQRLLAAQQRFAGDPLVNLQIMTLALQRLSEQAPEFSQSTQARGVIFKALDSGAALAQARAQILAQAKPGQKVQLPPAYEWLALRQLAGAIQAGQGKPAVIDMSRAALNKIAGDLAREAAERLDLGERLKASGLITSSYGYRGMYGGGSPSYGQMYAPLAAYKLDQIAAIKTIIQQAAQDPSKLKPEQIEFLDRALKALDAIEKLGPASGMVLSTAPGVAPAEDMNAFLDKAYSAFQNAGYFIQALREKGLAPMNGAYANAERWSETYTKEQIVAIRKIVEEMIARGTGWDGSGNTERSLTWNERAFLDGAIAEIDAVLVKNFPEPGQPGTPGPQGQATPADNEKALWARVNAPGQESLALVRLFAALGEAEKYEQGFNLRVLQFALELSRSGRGAFPAEDVYKIADTVFAGLSDGQAPAFYAALEKSLAGAARYSPQAVSARQLVDKQIKALVVESAKVFDETFSAKLVAKGLRTRTQYGGDPHDHGCCGEGGGSYDSDLAQYNQTQLRELLALIEAEAAFLGPKATAQQKALAVKARAELSRLLALAVAAGTWPGGTYAETLAPQVNALILPGHQIFYGSTLLEAIAAKGGGDPKNVLGTSGYTREDLTLVKAALAEILASGQGFDGNGRRPLTDNERAYLEQAIPKFEKLIAEYPAVSAPAPVVLPPAPAAPAPAAKPKDGKKAPKTYRGFALAGVLGLSLPSWIGIAILVGVGIALAWFLVKRQRALRLNAPSLNDAASSVNADAMRGAERAKRMELAASKMASSILIGGFRSRKLGAAGFEFGELREFQPGDDRRRINWRATAAQGKVLVNRYNQEKDMPAVVVLDISASGRYAASESPKELVARELAAMTVLAAAQSNMRAGAIVGTDAVEFVQRPQSGRGNAAGLAQKLAAIEPQGRGTDLKALLERAARDLPAGSQVFIVSDFLSATDYREALKALAQRHEVHAVRVVDPLEQAPVAAGGELVEIEDLESGARRIYDSRRNRREEESALLRREAEVETLLAEARVDAITISTVGAAEGRHLDQYADHFKPKKVQ